MFKLKQMFAVLLLSSACALSGASLAADKAASAAAPSISSVSSVPASTPVMAAASGMVNLNTADVATLARELSGVGDVKARAIVDYRAAHGAFTSVDQLLEVQGVVVGILEKNRNKLTVN